MIKNNIIYNEYSNWVFDISKAKGCHIYDTAGFKLIDFTSGWNVTNLGWNNSEVVQAVVDQAKINTYAPMWTADSIQTRLASELLSVLPVQLDSVGRATGGTEANEEAIKTARAYTGRQKIIGFKNTYHGQSFGTMALGYIPEFVTAISPLVGKFVQIEFPSIFGNKSKEAEILSKFSADLEHVLQNNDVAAIVTEAGIVTGWGSTQFAPKGYLKIVRELTSKYGTLLILDEVGTGFSRLGKLFAMELENVIPDIVTFAKALSNGVAAIGAMVTTRTIAESTFKKTNITSTFGWMPLSCAAALKTLQIHKREKIWEQSYTTGEYLKNTLTTELTNNELVEDIRGVGMEIGVQFKPKLVDQIVTRARKNGLHTVCNHESVIQIMPPLIIEKSVLNQGIDIFISTVKSFS